MFIEKSDCFPGRPGRFLAILREYGNSDIITYATLDRRGHMMQAPNLPFSPSNFRLRGMIYLRRFLFNNVPPLNSLEFRIGYRLSTQESMRLAHP